MTTHPRSHKIPRIGAATAITVAGGTVMIGGQPVAAADFVVTTDSAVLDGIAGDPDGPDDELSLADAVYAANLTPELDTITFDSTLVAGGFTIDTVNVPKIGADLTIAGPGEELLTLTNTNGAALYVYNSAGFTVSGVTIDGPLVGGLPADGIVVGASGDVAIDQVTITDVHNGVLVGAGAHGSLQFTNLTVQSATGAGVDANAFTDAVVSDITVDDVGDRGLEFGDATSVTASRVTVSGSNNSAFDTFEVDEVVLADITSTNTAPGTDLYAGRVSVRYAASADLTDIEVSGARDTSPFVGPRAGVFVSDTDSLVGSNISVTDSGDGISLWRTGAADLDAVSATGTDDIGLEIVQSWGTTSLDDVTIADNGGIGVVVDGTGASHPDGGDLLGDVQLTASTISGNDGGGVSVIESGGVEIIDVDVLDNGTDAGPTVGGVSFGLDTTPDMSVIADTVISGNEGDFAGGVGVVDSDVEVILENVALAANSGPSADAVGVRGLPAGSGGIGVSGSTITDHTGIASELFVTSEGFISVASTTIADNSGFSVVEGNGSNIVMQAVEIRDNEASDALIRSDGGSETDLIASLVTGNFATTLASASGASLVKFQTSTASGNTTVDSIIDAATGAGVNVLFTTITDNEVTDASGTLLVNDGSAQLVSDSSIWSGNAANGWIDAPGAAADPRVDFSIIPTNAEFGVDGSDNVLTDDPEMGPLHDNGGPTRSHLPDKASPSVDAANPTPPTALEVDQRLFPRGVNGRDDIGAVERQLSPFVIGLPPARVLETRTGPTYETIDGDDEGIGRRINGEETMLQVAGRAGVPADAEAVVINVTAVDPDGVGFVTVHPCLTNPPLASSLNFRGDVDSGNEIVAELTADGKLCLFNRGVTDLVVDVVGYVPNDSRYAPVGPARLLDTRDTGATIDGLFEKGGTRQSDTELELDVAGRGGVSADATAVVINVTAVKPTGIGYVTVHPCLPTEPNAASLNFEAGVNRGNEIVAELNADGKLCLYTWGSAELIVDVVGQLTDENTYETVPPARLYETRAAPNGTVDDRQEDQGRLDAREVVTVEAAGRAGVPADAKGVVVNTTAIRTDNRGFLTVWDCTGAMPLAASLNYTTGEIVGNELVVDLNGDGEFCVFSNRATDLTVDVVGYLF